ncbi:hypothetical protein ACFQY7_38085 [Actinomadura luteofluorescens]|uniref:hypothetical protein n=1 Tax=Actinomadura luteofluorescens TaxID=46163 RepID=UPI003628A93E
MTVASPARPESRAAGVHRLVCRNCGAAEDVDRAAEHDPCLEPRPVPASGSRPPR